MLFICDGISSGESDSVQDRNNQGWCQVRCSDSSCTNISQRNDTNCAEPSLSAIAVSTRAGSVRRIVMITHLRFSDKLLRTSMISVEYKGKEIGGEEQFKRPIRKSDLVILFPCQCNMTATILNPRGCKESDHP